MKYVINLLNEKRSQLTAALERFAFLKGSNTYADTEKQIAEIDKAISILNGKIRVNGSPFCKGDYLLNSGLCSKYGSYCGYGNCSYWQNGME
jgi:hypothetical protein